MFRILKKTSKIKMKIEIWILFCKNTLIHYYNNSNHQIFYFYFSLFSFIHTRPMEIRLITRAMLKWVVDKTQFDILKLSRVQHHRKPYLLNWLTSLTTWKIFCNLQVCNERRVVCSIHNVDFKELRDFKTFWKMGKINDLCLKKLRCWKILEFIDLKQIFQYISLFYKCLQF